MLTPKQVSWKNRANAIAWCNLKKVKFIDYGAFDVHYQKPEQKGGIIKQALGFQLKKGYEVYSSINWLDVFKDLQAAKHRMVRIGNYKPAKKAKPKRKQANRACL
jgi:hypothetical protein